MSMKKINNNLKSPLPEPKSDFECCAGPLIYVNAYGCICSGVILRSIDRKFNLAISLYRSDIDWSCFRYCIATLKPLKYKAKYLLVIGTLWPHPYTIFHLHLYTWAALFTVWPYSLITFLIHLQWSLCLACCLQAVEELCWMLPSLALSSLGKWRC